MSNSFFARFSDPRYKSKAHIGQIIMIVLVMALAIGKIATRPSYIPMNRLDLVGISMSGKTILVLAYQHLTEHKPRFQRWGSPLAYAIINTLEVVMWCAVPVVTLWGLSMVCIGISCTIGWFIVLASVIMA
ncbi:uncharacterized protein CTRU02_214554 [Colletotrichum truncatum]|uniref:Uncharacterized protein n=1 Tax=Colletotrichum truncatum TaxID=5467 RepID=A0ACC3YF56_COLTU|nr:uncharacterized protein CTRU02_12223 [Colletotrichum truncatum]KAF6785012.1 hypothetical protein CTRU02_12223 [Colletotrichum truncatum]